MAFLRRLRLVLVTYPESATRTTRPFSKTNNTDRDIALVSSDYRLMNFNTSLLKTKTTTNTQGVQAFTAKKGRSVTTVGTTEEILGAGVSAEKFTAQSLPSAGALMKENDMPSLFD